MRKTIIGIILLAAAGGGAAYYYYIADRAAENELAAAVPADTLLYEHVTNSKRLIERMAALRHADAHQLDSQMQEYRELAAQFGNAARLLLGMYEVAAKQKTNDQLVPGLDAGSQTAVYTVGLVPVLRARLSDPAAFRRFVQAAEQREGARGQDGTFQGVAYRSYDIEVNGTPAATKLLLAIRGKYAVVTLDVPQFRNESLPVALGLKAPARSLAQTDLPRRISPNAGAPPDNVGFLNHEAIVAALVGASGSSAGEMLTRLDGEHRLAPLRTPACQRDLQSMAKVWPITTWSTRSTRLAGGHGSGVSLQTHMLSEITDASLAAQLVKLRGHIPPQVSDGSAKPILAMALGLNVSSVGSVLGALRRRFLQADFHCEWLVKSQRRVDGTNPFAASMATGLFGSVKGVSLSLFGLQTPPKGSGGTKPQGADVLLTVSAEQPAQLIGLLGRMQPQLLGSIDIPADGTPVPVPLPGTGMTATARIVGSDIALYHGPRAERVAQTLAGDDLAPDGISYYRIDYAKLAEFLAGRSTPQRLGKGVGAANVKRFEESLQRMAQTKVRIDVHGDFTKKGVVMNAKMAMGGAP